MAGGAWTRRGRDHRAWKIKREPNKYSASMVAEPWDESPTAMKQPEDDAEWEDRCQQIEARLGVVHTRHQLVQKRFVARVETLEAKDEKKDAARAEEERRRQQEAEAIGERTKYLENAFGELRPSAFT